MSYLCLKVISKPKSPLHSKTDVAETASGFVRRGSDHRRYAARGNAPFINLGLGALTLAILLGIIAGNTVYPHIKPQCEAGLGLPNTIFTGGDHPVRLPSDISADC